MTQIVDLDHDITSVFSLVAVLLVFVFAYFSTIWVRAEELLDLRPVDGEDRRRVRTRIRNQRRLLQSMAIAVVSLGALLVPLSSRVVRLWRWRPFDTVQAALLLLDVFLVAMMVVAGWLWSRLRTRVRELASPATRPTKPGIPVA